MVHLYDTTPSGLKLPRWTQHRRITVTVDLHTRTIYRARITHVNSPDITLWYSHKAGKENRPHWQLHIGSPDKPVELTQPFNMVLRDLMAYGSAHGLYWGTRRRQRQSYRRDKRA